ncbi:uncharacterized protein V1510DRAFT_416164 [Dipodascopsis tothii]|uniref:uncharacterized protein n=1 Tax=Dipodascopsis tothii TaxID=44089 RepID=UPI0034CEA0BF
MKQLTLMQLQPAVAPAPQPVARPPTPPNVLVVSPVMELLPRRSTSPVVVPTTPAAAPTAAPTTPAAPVEVPAAAPVAALAPAAPVVASVTPEQTATFVAAPASTEIADLRVRLATAEAEIVRMRGAGTKMSPEVMPDARKAVPDREKLYYRLEMDAVDNASLVDLGNLVKNILLQLSTPLSGVRERVQSLNRHLQNEERYMRFAADVHEALYSDLPMGQRSHGLAFTGSNDELRCLREMLHRIEQNARAADRRRMHKILLN